MNKGLSGMSQLEQVLVRGIFTNRRSGSGAVSEGFFRSLWCLASWAEVGQLGAALLEFRIL